MANTRSRTGSAGTLVISALYFGPILAPHWAPGFIRTAAYVGYCASLFLAVLVLIVALLASWLVVGVNGESNARLASVIGFRSMLVLATLAGVVILSTIVGRGLPPGSYLMEFDSAAWRRPGADDYARGDITIRQKMLGAVARRVLPGRTRREIEAALGPSLDTGYFKSMGRDLVYVTGPERGLFAIDSEWLLIWLDESGRFDHYKIASD